MRRRDKIEIIGFKPRHEMQVDTESAKAVCISGMYYRNQWLPKSCFTIVKVEDISDTIYKEQKRYTIKLKDWYAKKEFIKIEKQ